MTWKTKGRGHAPFGPDVAMRFDNDGMSLYIPKSLQGDPVGRLATKALDRRRVCQRFATVIALMRDAASVIDYNRRPVVMEKCL